LFPSIFPGPLRPNIVDQKSHTLVVRRVQPKHAVADSQGFRKLAYTPKAKPEPMHTPKERPIVD
jgi:hypothetical protein